MAEIVVDDLARPRSPCGSGWRTPSRPVAGPAAGLRAELRFYQDYFGVPSEPDS